MTPRFSASLWKLKFEHCDQDQTKPFGCWPELGLLDLGKLIIILTLNHIEVIYLYYHHNPNMKFVVLFDTPG
jgi:hypothetical protein